MSKLLKELSDYFSTPLDSVAITTSDSTIVPNKLPRLSSALRLAIIGEAPGADEVRQGEPFVGMSGRLLTALLSKAGIVRDACFVGNISQLRPPNNDISLFSRSGPEIAAGLDALSRDLNEFQPNICLLLGKTALWAAKAVDNIGDWRGSLFVSDVVGPFYGRKCITSYHPAACLRQHEWTPLLMFDIRKARSEADKPQLTLPQRDLIIDATFGNVIDRLKDIKARKPTIAIDIEGYVDAMSCFSIADSPQRAFIVPIATRSNDNIWTLDEEVEIWRHSAAVLEDPEIPKILQNSLYDRFVLQYSYGIVVRGVIDDTMLKHHELYCELEKGLGFLCSLYTNEPFYKMDRKSENREEFWRYCCRDSAVTYEISVKLGRMLDPYQTQHYIFNVSMLNPLLYMELRGIRYDSALAAQRLHDVNSLIYELQYNLDEVSGYGFRPTEGITREGLLNQLREVMCYKKDRDRPKKAYEAVYPELRKRILWEEPLSKALLSQFNIECDLSLNIKSAKLKHYLYDTLKLPIQYKRDPKTKMEHPSTDYESLLRLSKKTSHTSIALCIELGLLRTRAQMLGIHADPDGRIRCGYNIVGTETGRITCYTSPTGSGYNLQTIPAEDTLKPEDHPLRRGMRDLFVADPEHYLFQCDLAGADGWTVGAHLARLGDPTMLDDLRAGLKPARNICYMLRHGNTSLNGLSRAEIADAVKEVRKEDWDYFACKQGIWGTCYLMGPIKLATVILIQSEGKINLSMSEVRDFQTAVFSRYNVKLWHDSTARALSRKAEITSASGHRRRFFGLSQEVLGQALAHEPQSNTTYAINLAALKLWSDPENCMYEMFQDAGGTSNGGPSVSTLGGVKPRWCLRVEPLHQVHDALLGKFRRDNTPWALGCIKSSFNNTLMIAGSRIVIPFDGAYGTDWALEDGKGKVGAIL